jgi:hypothetical protein
VVEGEILLTEVVRRRRPMLVAAFGDSTGMLTLRFFHFTARQQQALGRGARLRCFGEVRAGQRGLEMVHPEIQRLGDEAEPTSDALTPIYPATEGLVQARIRYLVHLARSALGDGPPELLPPGALAGQGLPTLAAALDLLHGPPPGTDLAALESGAEIINDVTALRHDPTAVDFLARNQAPIVLMHMPGTVPRAMQAQAEYADVVLEVARFLRDRVATLEALGIARARIAIDPGIGFGKTMAHNLALIEALPILAQIGCPIMLGASRKRFIGTLSGVEQAEARLAGSLAVALAGAVRGAAILRVHDVAETIQALAVWQACANGRAG